MLERSAITAGRKGNVGRFTLASFTGGAVLLGGVAVVSYNNVTDGLVDRNGADHCSATKRISSVKFHDGLAPFTDLTV